MRFWRARMLCNRRDFNPHFARLDQRRGFSIRRLRAIKQWSVPRPAGRLADSSSWAWWVLLSMFFGEMRHFKAFIRHFALQHRPVSDILEIPIHSAGLKSPSHVTIGTNLTYINSGSGRQL